jgi:predicted transcriptional regulator
MNLAHEMKRNKEQFLREMYSLAEGRFGILIDSYDLGEKYNLGWEKLQTVIEYLEAKGHIASYEGTLYASLTLKGVEYVERRS